jgi:CHAT domain-containing protein
VAIDDFLGFFGDWERLAPGSPASWIPPNELAPAWPVSAKNFAGMRNSSVINVLYFIKAIADSGFDRHLGDEYIEGQTQLKKYGSLGLIALIATLSVCLPLSLSAFSTSVRANMTFEQSFGRGEMERNRGNFSEAADGYARALSIAAELGWDRKQIECLMKLGVIHWNLGDLANSSNAYRRALVLAERAKRRKEIEGCRLALEIEQLYRSGKELAASNMVNESLDCFKRAIELARKIGSQDHEAKCLRLMSTVYYEENELDRFLDLNQQALALYDRLNNEREKGYCLFNIGLFYKKQLAIPQALGHLNEALRIAKENAHAMDKVDCLFGLGDIFLDLGDFFKAIGYYSEAKEAIDKEEVGSYAPHFLSNLGYAYRRKAEQFGNKQDLGTALNYYFEALNRSWQDKDTRTEAWVLNNIGYALAKLGRYSEALRFLRSGLSRAVRLGDQRIICNLLANRGTIFLEEGNLSLAAQNFRKSIVLSLGAGHLRSLWESFWGLGRCYEESHCYDKAEHFFRNAIANVEQFRNKLDIEYDKVGFIRNKLVVYDSLIHLLFGLNKRNCSHRSIEDVYYAIESAKARSFTENIQEQGLSSPALNSSEGSGERKRISQRISLIMKTMVKAGGVAGEDHRSLTELDRQEDAYSRLASSRRSTEDTSRLFQPLQLKNLQEFLRARSTVLLEYWLGEEESYVLGITGSKCGIWPLPRRSLIETSVRPYIKMVSSIPRGRFRGDLAARRIYSELLFPLEHLSLEGCSNLVIIPDGLLYYLPFETLAEERPQGNGPGRLLLEKFSISYCPSATSLAWISKLRHHTSAHKDLLALGNPDYGAYGASAAPMSAAILRDIYLDQGFHFSPLPYAAAEVRNIASLFPRSGVNVLVGTEANERAIKETELGDYRLIHFACHGFLDDRSPSRSALVLSPNENEADDGFLQAREICDLRIGAEMVVLSACQSGRGCLEKGEGPLGLSRAFFYAGAKSVVSSLWPISDRSTSILMGEFYSGLRRGLGKSMALRQAKLRMMRSGFSHPFHWAAFVLSGDYCTALRDKQASASE